MIDRLSWLLVSGFAVTLVGQALTQLLTGSQLPTRWLSLAGFFLVTIGASSVYFCEDYVHMPRWWGRWSDPFLVVMGGVVMVIAGGFLMAVSAQYVLGL
jgi:hypothetical protein